MKHYLSMALLSCVSLVPVPAQALVQAPTSALCYEQAGWRYGVSPILLQVIAQKESALRPWAVNVNADGSRDLGLMQINSRWLAVLKSQGISERDLYDPCTSLHVAAWILASNFRTMGLGWEAIGAYNARSADKRMAYASDVLMRLRRLVQQRAS